MSSERSGLPRAVRRVALAAAGLAALALVPLSISSCGSETRAESPARRRHVILVVADTLRADRLSAYGYPKPTTPALERLSASGTLFERAFTPAPWTLPALASLMTSTWPRDHGAGLHGEERNLLHQVPQPLAADGPSTLAECLQGASYPTTAIATNPFFGFGIARGFDRVDASYGINALEVVARGEQQLEQWGDQGGFLYLHFMDVHDPLAPDDADLEALAPGRELPARPHTLRDIHARLHLPGTREERGWVYDAAIRRIDRALERLFAHLERRGWLEEAIVIFTADHGEALWEHERIERWHYDRGASAGMGHGQSLFQELTGVPLVVWARELEDGRSATPVSLVDIAPSVLQWLDCPVAPRFATRGADLAEARAGRLPPRDLVLEGIGMGRERRALVDARGTKAISGADDLEPLLAYDLAEDPREERPLASSPHVQQLSSRLDGPSALPRRAASFVEISTSALESMRALGYLSAADVGLPARSFGDPAGVRDLSAIDLRELPLEGERGASNGEAREASGSTYSDADLVTLVGLPGGPHPAGKAAFVAVRARPRVVFERTSENEIHLRLPPRGEARLGLAASAPIAVETLLDGEPRDLPLASAGGALPRRIDPPRAGAPSELPPIDLAAGAHLFRDPLLEQTRFQWIARAADLDQAERVSLRFRSEGPLRAATLPPSPLPHASWSLLTATENGWTAVGTLVDPPLEGEAAVLAGDRLWVAGAGPEHALWIYAFAFDGGKLVARERLRLPLASSSRVRKLRDERGELVVEIAGAERLRRWTWRPSVR